MTKTATISGTNASGINRLLIRRINVVNHGAATDCTVCNIFRPKANM